MRTLVDLLIATNGRPMALARDAYEEIARDHLEDVVALANKNTERLQRTIESQGSQLQDAGRRRLAMQREIDDTRTELANVRRSQPCAVGE